jgi:uncharacterized SAM-binding protein YcdF (DUF218 family)
VNKTPTLPSEIDYFYPESKKHLFKTGKIVVMTILIKFIALPLYPLGMSIMLVLTGLLMVVLKRKRLAICLNLTGFIVLLIFSSPVISQLLAQSLENKAVENLPPPGICSAIVLLAGGERPLIAPRKYPEINEAGDRVLHAARIFKMGAAPIIISTGGDPGTALYNALCGAKINAMLLKELGIDSSAIVIEPKARNTHEHASYVAKVLDSLQLKKNVVLVTSATHMARSVAVFKKFNGYTLYTAPTDYKTANTIYNSITDFFPSSSALELSTSVLHEYYGLLGYKLLGWI